eukprot:s2393_g12.t1
MLPFLAYSDLEFLTMTEPHLPGIPDLKQNTEGDADSADAAKLTLLFPRTEEVPAPLSLKTLTSVETESPRALRAWLSEELQRHNAALCKHLDEAFDRQLKSQRSAFERLAFQNGAHGVQSQTFSREHADLHADLRLAGLCLPPPAAPVDVPEPGLKAWSQGDSDGEGEAPVPTSSSKLEKSPTSATSTDKAKEFPKETKPAAPKAAPPPGPGLEPPPILPAPETKDGSEGTSSINTLSQDDVANQDRRPSRMQEAWEEAQLEEKKRRASQVLGTTYNKLVTRIEIDFKESVVDAVVSFLVVLYTFILLLQTQWRGFQAAQRLEGKEFTDEDFQDWPGAETAFFIVDHIFNMIFVLEIAWRLYMHKWKFLCDIFGVFDVLVVIATSIDVYVLQPFDAGYAQNFAVGRLTRIFRLMRIFRVLRVMRFAKNLQQLRLLGDVLSKCLSPLMWALLVLGIIMVGTGVLMSQLLLEYVLDTTQDLEKRQWVYEYYGTALKATYSVFEATFSGSWPLLARNLIRDVSEWCLGSASEESPPSNEMSIDV